MAFQQYGHCLHQVRECQHLTHFRTSQLVCSNMRCLLFSRTITLQMALHTTQRKRIWIFVPMAVNLLFVTVTKAKHFVQGFRCHPSPIVHENQTVEAVKILHVNAEPARGSDRVGQEHTDQVTSEGAEPSLLLCFDVRIHCIVKQFSHGSKRPSM